MAALHKERFSNRLPTKVEINNADQLRHIIASQVTEGQPVDLSLAVDGGEIGACSFSAGLRRACPAGVDGQAERHDHAGQKQ